MPRRGATVAILAQAVRVASKKSYDRTTIFEHAETECHKTLKTKREREQLQALKTLQLLSLETLGVLPAEAKWTVYRRPGMEMEVKNYF